MSRTITVQVVTDHGNTEQAAASLVAALRREGYDYVDWRPLTDRDEPLPGVITADSHAVLQVASVTELEGAVPLSLDGAWPEPQISPPGVPG